LRDKANKHLVRFTRQPKERTYLDLLRGSEAREKDEDKVTSVVELYQRFEGWLDSPGVRTVTFRHLVGARGGSSRLRQLYEADAIARLVAPEPTVDVDECARQMFNEKHSLFVKGQVDAWKEVFTEELNAVFERECRPKLARFMAHIAQNNPPGWESFAADPRSVRRAWWLAERDLADLIAERQEARVALMRLQKHVEHVEQDSQKRLSLIRDFERRLREMDARLKAATPPPAAAAASK
jgi:hypothetical protein